MADFLEGQALTDAVAAKLAKLGRGISADDWAAQDFIYPLFKKYWEQSMNSGDLQWNHASAGVMHELALMVLELRKRVTELTGDPRASDFTH